MRRSSEEADRLSQLAEDLLLIARADRGGLPLRLEPLDVDELLAAVASRFEWRARGARARASARRRGRTSACDGDRLRLEQALGNLVDNALRHGGGRDHACEPRPDDGCVELHVRDDGAGFPPEFLDARVRAVHAAPTRRAAARGAGLGLSIVRTIAEAHGGSAQAANGAAAVPTSGSRCRASRSLRGARGRRPGASPSWRPSG